MKSKIEIAEHNFKLADDAYEAALKVGNYLKSNAAYIARAEALEKLIAEGGKP